MKISHYLLGLSILTSGIDLIFTSKISSLQACPRCRRALPKGPLKRPNPRYLSRIHTNNNDDKTSAINNTNECGSSCCCSQKKTSSSTRNEESSYE